MNHTTRIRVFALSLCFATAIRLGSAPPDSYALNPGVPWPATDGLGRTLPMAGEVGPPRPDRFVGIFYFLWLGQHDYRREGPFVVGDIMRKNPDALKTSASPPWGPPGAMYFWGEPLYGFYLNSDPWVLRRHAHLLADAGVDTLILDATNANSYHEVYLELLKVFRQIRQEGGHTPQIAFMTNTDAGARAQEIFEDLYEPGLYSDLWFRWEGKPLLICDPDKASAAVRAFFTLRRAHWPFTHVDTPYAWHWEAAYPQPYGFTEDPKVPEQINVSVAQNLNAAPDGKVTSMSSGDARGRSYHDGALDRSPGAIDRGLNFQEQWSRALKLDPPFVMVTGWNEWIAGRFSRPGEDVAFIDQFDEQFSRDIEMMKGGHGDDYYYQLLSNVRRFKGMPALRKASVAKVIATDGEFAQWRDVQPEYLDYIHETAPRDYDGAASLHYVNKTGRNDLELMKVARDEHSIYFYVRTRDPITPRGRVNWMTLFLDTDHDAKTGWHGYDFVVNRVEPSESEAVLEKSVAGGKWEKVAGVRYQVKGREMQIAVPRENLGLTGKAVTLDFKWTDNLADPLDIMDFYLSGDVAPEGRFNYRYSTE